jgi:hypothetical protein
MLVAPVHDITVSLAKVTETPLAGWVIVKDAVTEQLLASTAVTV